MKKIVEDVKKKITWEKPVQGNIQHNEILLPAAQPGRTTDRFHLWAVWQAHRTESGTEAETVLLWRLPEQVVEQPLWPGKAKDWLYFYLPNLRKRAHCLWQQSSEVLFPRLLYCLPVFGGSTPWIRGRFKMKQPSRWRCIWQGWCWRQSSSPNMERDRTINDKLINMEGPVLRFWEGNTEKKLQKCVDTLCKYCWR